MTPAPDKLERLRELEQAATPGPWKPYPGSSAVMALHDDDVNIEADTPEDAAFIAAARNALPALLDVAEAARALSEDEESQEGGWGPDVTMLYPLREALARLDANA